MGKITTLKKSKLYNNEQVVETTPIKANFTAITDIHLLQSHS